MIRMRVFMIYEIRNTQYYFTFNGWNSTMVFEIRGSTCEMLLLLVLWMLLVRQLLFGAKIIKILQVITSSSIACHRNTRVLLRDCAHTATVRDAPTICASYKTLLGKRPLSIRDATLSNPSRNVDQNRSAV